MMDNENSWRTLEEVSDLDKVIELSHSQTVGIFKHSIRCSISSMAKSRMESKFSSEMPSLFLLDLINHRDVSNAIEERFSIRHESPQLILIKDGKSFYNASHGYINMNDVLKSVKHK